MRKHIIEQSALEVATQVRAVEESIDNALADIAELLGRMIRARLATGVGVATGHEAFEHLSATLHSLVTARGGMAGCHAALRDAQTQVPGLRTVSFGDGSECPEKKVAQLRAVA
jgi:hypothetical protein